MSEGSSWPVLALYFNNNKKKLQQNLGISGWGCATGTLEPLAYTRALQLNFATLY